VTGAGCDALAQAVYLWVEDKRQEKDIQEDANDG